ncbi:hypothetical protein FPZ41_39145 [Streptomyces sp. K1PN6]|uniref:Secreted protein n=1 Tax=Streptomyces acidicola TaxID=2596892 RepID=A0A5N8X3V2_9ACTN|nr:hypothetical protein [Streptomyces acidicola]
MRLRRAGTVLGAAVLTVLTIPANAHAAAIACGGGTSTGRVAVNGCISAQRQLHGHAPFKEVTAYVKLRNTGTRAVNVSYEAYWRTSGFDWTKLGSSRTNVGAGMTVGPLEVGTKDRACDGIKVEIRVRAQVGGGSWSGWAPASTKQCQT